MMHNGISIASMQIASIEIRGFYLSLNKKLILSLDLIDLSPLLTRDGGGDSSDLSKTLGLIEDTKLLLAYFEEINLKEIVLGENRGSLLYKDGHYILELPPLRAVMTLDEVRGRVAANIEEVAYDDFRFKGSANYDALKNSVSFDGNISLENELASDLILSVRGESDFEQISIEGESTSFSSLKFLDSMVKIEEPELRAWLFDNVVGDGMELASFSFKSRLDEHSIMQALKENLNARLDIAAPTIRFHPEVPAVSTRGVSVIYDSSGLHFELFEPEYEGFALDGSRVDIRGLWDEHSYLDLFLKTEAALDERIHKILHAYGITLPLSQNSSTTIARLNLEINLGSGGVKNIGFFEAQNANFDLDGLKFHAKDVSVKLVDSIVEILPKSRASIGDWLDSELAFSIDTEKSLIEGKANVIRLAIENGEVLAIKNLEIPFSANFSGKTTPLHLNTLGTAINIGKSTTISVSDLSLLYPYSKLLQSQGLKEGNLELRTDDFSRFLLDAELKNPPLPLLNKDGSSLASIKLLGEISSQRSVLNTPDNKLRINIAGGREVFIDGYDVVVPSELNSTSSDSALDVMIFGKDSDLIYKGKRISANSTKIDIKNQQNLTLELTHKNGKLNATMLGSRLKIDAQSLSDEFINRFFNKDVARGGRFNLNAEYSHGVLKGRSIFYDTTLKNLNTLQNIVALVDTIPSLLVFKAPGFSSEGYEVEKGVLDLGVNEQYAVIEKFDFHGSSIDMNGSGVVELDTDNIEFKARIKTLKSLGTIVSNIPLLGYIIMGDDGSLATEVVVHGTIDNPIAETNLASETIKAPLNILERLIKTPLRLLDE